MVKNKAFFALIRPAGISRIAVRGFKASISRSRYRLNAMAELRAVTMQISMSTNNIQLKGWLVVCTAKKKPINAKGIAKMLCAKRTKERYFFI